MQVLLEAQLRMMPRARRRMRMPKRVSRVESRGGGGRLDEHVLPGFLTTGRGWAIRSERQFSLRLLGCGHGAVKLDRSASLPVFSYFLLYL